MTPADLEALAARIEAASGPDRELDAEIYNAVPVEAGRKAERLPMEQWGDRFDDGWRTMLADREDKYPEKLKRYTASLDAAMTLVPEGWMQFDVDATAPDLGIDWTLHRHGIEVKATAATPALALTAATLRARAKEQSGE